MNGPEHYREAERLLSSVRDALATTIKTSRDISLAEADRIKARVRDHLGDDRPLMVVGPGVEIDFSTPLLAAQVHATLALAAPANGITS